MGYDDVVAKLAERQHGVFSHEQVLVRGLTSHVVEHRISSQRWIRIHKGVYGLKGLLMSESSVAMAACLAGRPKAVASHHAAGWLHSMPGIKFCPEITVDDARHLSISGVQVHRASVLNIADVEKKFSVPCTTPARTLIDLASILGIQELESALDDTLARRLITLSYLQRRIAAVGRQGRKGIGNLQSLVNHRASNRPRCESQLERRLLKVLQQYGVPLPMTQFNIVLSNGRSVRLDAAYPHKRLALEADSYRYHSSLSDWSHDHGRNNAIVADGWRILPIMWDQLRDAPELVAIQVKCALDAARVG